MEWVFFNGGDDVIAFCGFSGDDGDVVLFVVVYNDDSDGDVIVLCF